MQTILSNLDAMIWEFLRNSYNGGRILAADCSEELLAKIMMLSPEPELVQWTESQRQEFCRNQWPETEGFFRHILFGRLAERMETVHAFQHLAEHLTYDGAVISIWGNVQHWTVIRDLLHGNWHFSENHIFQNEHHRLFSQNELLELFRFMHYKNLRINYITETGEMNCLEQLRLLSGMKDCSLLEVSFWVVEARLFRDEVIKLRRQLTPELRKELARILRRIEHDIEPDVNCKLAKDICKDQRISKEYLEAFVRNVTLTPHKVLTRLKEHFNE